MNNDGETRPPFLTDIFMFAFIVGGTLFPSDKLQFEFPSILYRLPFLIFMFFLLLVYLFLIIASIVAIRKKIQMDLWVSDILWFIGGVIVIIKTLFIPDPHPMMVYITVLMAIVAMCVTTYKRFIEKRQVTK